MPGIKFYSGARIKFYSIDEGKPKGKTTRIKFYSGTRIKFYYVLHAVRKVATWGQNVCTRTNHGIKMCLPEQTVFKKCDTHTDTQTHRYTDTQTDRQTDRQTGVVIELLRN